MPDGTYTAYTWLLDCWTPKGMLSLDLSDDVDIQGDLWLDWHIWTGSGLTITDGKFHEYRGQNIMRAGFNRRPYKEAVILAIVYLMQGNQYLNRYIKFTCFVT